MQMLRGWVQIPGTGQVLRVPSLERQSQLTLVGGGFIPGALITPSPGELLSP